MAGPAPAGRSGLAALFFLGAIAVIGLPPLSGFMGKVALLQTVPSPLYWLFLLGGGLLALVGMSRAGSTLFWRATGDGRARRLDRPRLAATVLLLSAAPALAIWGEPVLEATVAAAAQWPSRGCTSRRFWEEAHDEPFITVSDAEPAAVVVLAAAQRVFLGPRAAGPGAGGGAAPGHPAVLAERAEAAGFPKLVRFVLVVHWDIITANVVVARLILGSPRKLRPAFVELPLELTDDFAITLLASTISLTPGTVSADVSEDRRTLLIHALDMDDEAELVAQIKQRYERPLKEIFEC